MTLYRTLKLHFILVILFDLLSNNHIENKKELHVYKTDYI